MKSWSFKNTDYSACVIILVFLGALALGLQVVNTGTPRQDAGWINFALGATLVAAFVFARLVRIIGLPNLTGYIFAGILAGPFVSGFLGFETVERLKLIDELALSVIALSAGAELHVSAMKKRLRAIVLNILLITLLVFVLVCVFIIAAGPFFNAISSFSTSKLIAFAILTGVVCVARSPSSTIAVINECRARGPFTETILSVTMITDILIIIMFTAALSVGKHLVFGRGAMNLNEIGFLGGEILISLLLGVLLGKAITIYISYVKHDFLIFLIVMAFCVSRASIGFNEVMEVHAGISIHLEPLLICMSAGFFIRNATDNGLFFIKNLDRIAMPIYVLFFSMAGAALNFDSLRLCWPLAMAVAVVRAAGMLGGSWLAGRMNEDPVSHQYCAWMAYLTQAGVAIGLAQLAMREFPGMGVHLNTMVLAVIAINQIVGPVLFKAALHLVDEAGK